jgi:hypothetical protein
MTSPPRRTGGHRSTVRRVEADLAAAQHRRAPLDGAPGGG